MDVLLLIKIFLWKHQLIGLLLTMGIPMIPTAIALWYAGNPPTYGRVKYVAIAVIFAVFFSPLLWIQTYMNSDFLPSYQECKTVSGIRVVDRRITETFEDTTFSLDSDIQKTYTESLLVTLCRKRLEFDGNVFGDWVETDHRSGGRSRGESSMVINGKSP